jgi:hypothetical protein
MTEKITRAAALGSLGSFAAASALPRAAEAHAPALEFVSIVPGVGYVPGDIERKLTCNTGVIESNGRLTIVIPVFSTFTI